jgi:xanthine permease XanP
MRPPPPLITLFNGIQQVGLISINIVYPLLIFRAVGLPVQDIGSLLAIGMLLLGLATFLQASRLGPVGTGFMCPATFTATYFPPSLLAASTGGLPLVFGMTIFAGAVETALAPLLHRLRAIFPPEISGLVILMIGLSAGLAGLRSLIGAAAAPVTTTECVVAAITLATMCSLNVWGRGVARMLCALGGLAAGYAAAVVTGLAHDSLAEVAAASWLGVPGLPGLSWSFEPAQAVAFTIAAVAAALKAAGTITVCQRMNDADWVRPDMTSVTRGVLADGLSTMMAGVVGTVGLNTSTPAVGLAAATGVASRRVAYAIGAIFMLLGFLPKLTALLAAMPRAVMLAALLFTVTFIIVNGLQIVTSRLIDARRTLVIGLALIAGTAVEAFPAVVALVPRPLLPILGSSLVLSTVVALVLNLLFRIGIRKTATLTLDNGRIDHQKVQDFFAAQTARWGARPDVASRATFGVVQLIDAVIEDFWTDGPLRVEASFDEFNLDVRVDYRGLAPEFPDRRPSADAIRASPEGAKLLAGFMLKRNADRVRAEQSDGLAHIHFHFDH